MTVFNPQPTLKSATVFKKKPMASGSLGFKNVLILFFSAMAISLVVLVLFFGLFFQKVDFSLNTKPLENAPNAAGSATQTQDETSKATGLTARQLGDVFSEININVPTDANRDITPTPNSGAQATEGGATAEKPATPVAEGYIGIGSPYPDTGNSEAFDNPPTDVASEEQQPEEPAPLPKPKATSQKSDSSNNQPTTDPDFMPMAPLPGQ
jgi:hypothetical protein